MITVTQGWQEAVRASHARHLRIEVTYDGDVVTDDLPVSGGQLTLDLDSEVYATAEFDLADPSWLAKSVTELGPFGHRVRIHVGVSVGRDVEWIAVGPELLVTVVPTLAGAASETKITCVSLIRQVQDDRFLRPWQPLGSTRAAISALLTEAVPDATVTHTGSDVTVPEGLLFERERWEAARDLAARLDNVIRPVPGGFSVAPPPQPEPGTPVAIVDAGDQGVLLPGSLPALTRDDGWNGVVAQNPDDPEVWALVSLDDPEHPLRWGGPFGKRPQFFSSPLLTAGTVAAAAATRLSKLAGQARIIELEAVPNPAIEPGDIISVVWPGGANESVMVRKVQLPLAPAGGAAKFTVQGVDAEFLAAVRHEEVLANG